VVIPEVSLLSKPVPAFNVRGMSKQPTARGSFQAGLGAEEEHKQDTKGNGQDEVMTNTPAHDHRDSEEDHVEGMERNAFKHEYFVSSVESWLKSTY
jgi:hypothetical protein